MACMGVNSSFGAQGGTLWLLHVIPLLLIGCKVKCVNVNRLILSNRLRISVDGSMHRKNNQMLSNSKTFRPLYGPSHLIFPWDGNIRWMV